MEGVWTNRRASGPAQARADFQEAQRQKRKRDAVLQEQMEQFTQEGALRSVATELRAPEPEPEEAEEKPAIVFVVAPRPLPALHALPALPAPRRKVCYQEKESVPIRYADFVGNQQARVAAQQWLAAKHRVAEQPTTVERAMLLLYGPCGVGKTTWARWMLTAAGYKVCQFSPSDRGKHSSQSLVAFLQSQPAADLRGQKLAVLLDDVDELFSISSYKAARFVRARCPIVATCGPTPSRELRQRAACALKFSRLYRSDALIVVKKFYPEASGAISNDIVLQAAGDIRQLILRCSDRYLRSLGGADAQLSSFDASSAALCGTAPLPVYEDPSPYALAIVHENFPRCADLARHAAFLSDACILDSLMLAQQASRFEENRDIWEKTMEFMRWPMLLAARRWRSHALRGRLETPTHLQSVWDAPVAPESDASPAAEDKAAEDKQAAYEDRVLEPRRPAFRPGLSFAAQLLQQRLGAALEREATLPRGKGDFAEHVPAEVKVAFPEATPVFLSGSFKLAAEHVRGAAELLAAFR